MLDLGAVKKMPLTDQIAAISCGVVEGTAVLDLDYQEDSSAQVDANFVMTGGGGIVEIQTTAEKEPFSRQQLDDMLRLAESGIAQLVALQQQVLNVS